MIIVTHIIAFIFGAIFGDIAIGTLAASRDYCDETNTDNNGTN